MESESYSQLLGSLADALKHWASVRLPYKYYGRHNVHPIKYTLELKRIL